MKDLNLYDDDWLFDTLVIISQLAVYKECKSKQYKTK